MTLAETPDGPEGPRVITSASPELEPVVADPAPTRAARRAERHTKGRGRFARRAQAVADGNPPSRPADPPSDPAGPPEQPRRRGNRRGGDAEVSEPRRANRPVALARQLPARGAEVAGLARRVPVPAAVRTFIVPITTTLAAILLILAVRADPVVFAAAIAWCGLVVAWGWPTLLGSPSRVGTTAVVALAALATSVAAVLPPASPSLEFVPVAVAGSIIAAFVQQLARRDGRERLTEALAIGMSGIAVVALGSFYVGMSRTVVGVQMVTVALVAVAAGSIADLFTRYRSMRPWLLPVSMVLGGLAASVTVSAQGGPTSAPAILTGFVVAAVGHALRRVLRVLPRMRSLRGQLTVGLASILVAGVVLHTLALLLLG